MRNVAIAVVALLLAGCTATQDPDDGLPTLTGDPTSTPPTSTGPSSTTSSTASSTPVAPAPGVTLATGHEEDSATDAGFPGLRVSGQLNVSGNVARLEASAINIGERTYRVSSICVPPWSEGMRGPSGGDVEHRQPMAYCAAFGLRDFPPGDSIPFSSSWNGTLWDGDGYVAAPDGTYRWLARFQVYSGGESADFERSAMLDLEFQVTVA